MTKRNDYHAVDAVNRHAITPDGWVHEQDNSKLILSGEAPQTLVREIGVNTYTHDDTFQINIADDYWTGTSEYWKTVRDAWTRLEQENTSFALTLKGEPGDLYMPLLNLATSYMDGEIDLEAASTKAESVIATYTTSDLGALATRLRAPTPVEVAQN